MKKLYFIQLALLFCTVSNAQNVSYQWAGAMGGTDSDQGNSVAVDKLGNVYSTGFFMGKADFDPDPKNTSYLTSNGDLDIYILKLDAKGKFVWAVSMGDALNDAGRSINLDTSGNVYVTGYFEDKVDFDPGKGTTYLTSAGGQDIFVCKFDPSGALVFARQMGGLLDDVGNGIDVDIKNKVFTTGYFQDSADFDPDGKSQAILTSEGAFDIFVSALDNSGNYLWAVHAGGTSDDAGNGIALDSFGNVYTTGYFYDKVDFDPSVKGTDILASIGDADIFVLKLDANGNYLWAKSVGDNSFDIGNSIAVDASGLNYTTGGFYDSPDFNTGKGTTTLTSAGNSDIFVLKLDDNGDFVLAKNMGGSDDDIGMSIAIDDSKNIYTTGVFADVADFDPGSSTNNLTSAGSWDIFISKLTSAGNFDWAVKIGDSDYDNGTGIFVDKPKNLYTTGSFVSTVDFDPSSSTANLASAGSEDAFVLKMGVCKASSSSFKASSCNSYQFNGNTYTTSGDYTRVVKNSTGCDSIITLKLTINQTTLASISIGACDSYTLNGQTYTTEGTYSQQLVNKAGCDSFLFLELKFLTSSSSMNAKACDTYSLNSKSYTSSGKYTQKVKNTAGCDSTITLNLTIKKSTNSVLTPTVCDKYLLNNKPYTLSGTYYETLVNEAGCDSNVTLKLTVNKSSARLINQNACSTFALNGQTYTKSGTYVQTRLNTKGCDSVITLKLSVNNTDTSLSKTACNSFTFNTIKYVQSGIYTQKIPNKKGCDSTITLTLTVNSVLNTVTKNGLVLTANASSSGTTYKWLDCNKSFLPIPGEIYQSFKPSTTGDYAVEVTENSCSTNSECINVKVGSIKNNLTHEIHIFPNPTAGNVSVMLTRPLNNGSIKILNTLGQIMWEKSNLNEQSVTLNLADYALGLYYIEINDAGQTARIKVVRN